MKKNILDKKSIVEINKDLCDGNISAIDIAEEVINNFQSSNSSQNAFVQFDDKKIIESAINIDKKLKTIKCPPLCGIPISAKDLFGVNHYKTRAGTPKELWN